MALPNEKQKVVAGFRGHPDGHILFKSNPIHSRYGVFGLVAKITGQIAGPRTNPIFAPIEHAVSIDATREHGARRPRAQVSPYLG